MQNDQFPFLILHSIASFLSTKIDDDKPQCRLLYILLINAFSLIIFSQYMQDLLYLIAFIISVFFLIQQQKQNRRAIGYSLQKGLIQQQDLQILFKQQNEQLYSYAAVLLAVYLFTGGADYIYQAFPKSMQYQGKKEGFQQVPGQDYSVVNGMEIFTRRQQMPKRQTPYNPQNIGLTNMTAQSQVVRKQDPHYRNIILQDFDYYDDDITDYVAIGITPSEQILLQKIINIYAQYLYIVQQIKQGNSKNLSFTGVFGLIRQMVYRQMSEQETMDYIKQNVFKFNQEDTEYNFWANLLNSQNPLWIFLMEIVKKYRPVRIYTIVNNASRQFGLSTQPDPQLFNIIQKIYQQQGMQQQNMNLQEQQTDFNILDFQKKMNEGFNNSDYHYQQGQQMLPLMRNQYDNDILIDGRADKEHLIYKDIQEMQQKCQVNV